MSIASELARLRRAKNEIKEAIEDKGVDVPKNKRLDDYDDYVRMIRAATDPLEWGKIIGNIEDQEDLMELLSSLVHYEIYADLSEITDPRSSILYLIGPTGDGEDEYEEYVYVDGEFVKIGDASIDLSGKQDVIDDLADIRSGAAAGATAYQKPSTGIPKTDMASSVQTSLGKADTAYQKPNTGIPSSDMASAVQTSLGKADTAYQKPGTGIPSSDMASAVQTSLGKADTAYQKPSGGIPASDLASGVIPTDTVKYSAQTLTDAQKTQARTNIGSGTYSKPSSGIPSSDMASGVQESLELADSAVQAEPIGSIIPPVNPSEFATKEEVDELDQKVDGLPEVTFSKSDYELQPGLITGDIFRSNSVYGTKNSFMLIPMTGNAGRTIQLTTVSGHYTNSIAFLTTDVLVSGEAAPYCTGTSDTKTSGQYVVPDDCVCLYVYAEREGADSFPTLKMSGSPSEVCSTARADAIEENLADAVQEIDEIGKHITLLDVNEVTGDTSAVYTLSEAISAIPVSMRRGYCVLRYNTLIQSYYFQKIAFYKSSSLSNWSNTNYWAEIDIRDWSNVSESAGAFKMNYSGQTSVGANTSMRRVLVPFDKMVVYRHSSDNYGRWRILVRYADGTNEFVDITANEITAITPSKETLGFEFYLMSTSETCNIDADVLIGAAETVFELTYKTDPTAESLGAVPINQGIGNAGRPLVVGADGKVSPGTATPSTVDGDSVRKVLSRELHLGADSASLTTLGTGWSGSVENGFTHASGNTDPLVLNPTTDGNSYLVTINCSTNAENLYLVSIGDGPLLDPYNGTNVQRVGFISDGGAVKITPSSSFAGTMTIKVQECVAEEDATETLVLNVLNVEAENMGSAITAFWNVAIGPNQTTLGKAVSASRNIAIGINSLLNLETGTRNIGIGTFTMSQLKNGLGNIAIGADANFLRQGGDDNIAIGRAALGGNKSESTNNCIFIGVSAGSQAIGDNNIAIGKAAGYKATGGSVYIGLNAGFDLTGLNNIAIGRNSGYQGGTATGNWNTIIGPSASVHSGANKGCAIGYLAYIEKSGQNVIGSSDSVETKVFGDLVVHGMDGIDRRIVFNNDHTVTWEAVE